MRMISYTEWGNNGRFSSGTMSIEDAMRNITEYSRFAMQLQKQLNVDHVLYGMKKYDPESGELTDVLFYMHPMSDEEFENMVVPQRNAIVYAVHKH